MRHSLPRASQTALDGLLTPQWEAGEVMDAVVDSLSAAAPMLHMRMEPHFAGRCCQWAVALVIATYLAALLTPEVLPKVPGGVASGTGAGGKTHSRATFGSKLKLTQERQRCIARDERVLQRLANTVRRCVTACMHEGARYCNQGRSPPFFKRLHCSCLTVAMQCRPPACLHALWTW